MRSTSARISLVGVALSAFLVFLALVITAPPAQAAPEVAPSAAIVPPPLPTLPAAATAVPFDADAATRAYLDTVPAADHARSDAYFEGGYWLILVDFLETAGILLLLLFTGVSAKMRDVAAKVTGVRAVHVAVYWLLYFVATAVLSFPLSVYTDYLREHSYGLSNMTFGAWLADDLKGTMIGLVLGAVMVPVLYAVLSRARQTWWLWATLVAISFLAFVSAVFPVFIAPVFNQYTPLANAEVRGPILSLARANGIPATEVWQFDASRQSDRVSANVAGLLGTERISLNDNLLKRCSIPEIENVMGHEMGHYVLHHTMKGTVAGGILVFVGFLLVNLGFERFRVRYHARWKVEAIDDPAGLPLFILLFASFGFLATPIQNTLTRVDEAEADIFGLNAARQPDGMALVSLKLGQYRKLEPGPVEEFMFFDHPSGHTRIAMAMRWKAEHLGPPLEPAKPAN